MRRTLTPSIIRELLQRLCALPPKVPGIFDDLGGADSFEQRRIERALVKAARCDEDAAAITVKLERIGMRPDRQAIFRAARELETEFQIAIPPMEQLGRSVCTKCNNTGQVIEYRLCWKEWTESGWKQRARIVASLEDGFEQMKSLRDAYVPDVYSVGVRCKCCMAGAGISK